MILNYPMNKTITFLAKDVNSNLRLDKCLTSKLKTFTRSKIKKIILSKNVKVNNKTTSSPSQKIKLNDFIEVSFNENKIDHIKPKEMNIDIMYEDEEIVIVNKPSGLIVHPGAGNKEKFKEWIL